MLHLSASRTLLSVTFFSIAIGMSFSVHSEDSLQWRGTDGMGRSNAKDLPISWDESTNVAWKTSIPGRGWSTPVVQGNEIWLTTAVELMADESRTEERLKANTGDQPLTILERVELRAICVDRSNGEIKQNVLLIERRDPQWVHKLNSYASPSPVLERGRLYCSFGTYGTACLDTSRCEVLWTNTDLEVMHENGPGGSPIVVGNHVVFHMDGSDSQYIAALEKTTGKLAWTTDRTGEMDSNPQLRKSYGTPVSVVLGNAEQILSPASNWLYGYDPQDGKELWKLPYGELGFSLTPRPVVGDGILYMSTGFGRSQMLAIELDANNPKVLWRYKQGVPTMPSPLLVGSELYFISDSGGILTCLDAKTGEELYRHRLGGNFSASPMEADGNIYIGNREGAMLVIRAGRKYELLAENHLGGSFYASPVAVDHELILRTDEALYCISKSK